MEIKLNSNEMNAIINESYNRDRVDASARNIYCKGFVAGCSFYIATQKAVEPANSGEAPADNNRSPKLPLYSKVMEDIFGKDWAVDSRIISAEAEHKCHRVYNYIARQLRADA